MLLLWQRSARAGVSIDQPFSVALEIREVQTLALTPRDDEMPFTEDDCLNGVAFVSDEAWGREGFWVDTVPDESWRWCFDFMSGAAIVVAAMSAMLRVDGPPTESVQKTRADGPAGDRSH